MYTFRLILQTGVGAGNEFPLDKAEILVGRDLSNDVVVNDPEVSRRHARMILTGESYVIEDLGSTNGTFLRGQRLTAPVLLNSGDMITLGENVYLKFEANLVDPDATIAAFRRPAVPEAEVTPVAAPAPQPVQPVPPPPAAVQPPVAKPIEPQPQPVQMRPSTYVPITPPEPVEPEPPVRKKKSTWLVALLIVVGVLLVFCVIPWLIIEFTNSYCSLFAGFFNAIQPGACP